MTFDFGVVILLTMLTIRFKRVGRRNQPSYRVIVTPKRAGGPKGKPIEYLGWYNPFSKKFSLNKERILYWLSQGAETSASLHNLLIRAGLIIGEKIPVHKSSSGSTSTESEGTEAVKKEEEGES